MPSLYGIILKRRKARLEDILAMGEGIASPRTRIVPKASPYDHVQEGPGIQGRGGWGMGWRLGDRIVQWDGEIYNHAALHNLLDGSHDRPAYLLILNGWQREGTRFLQRINGPFALALWDLKEKTCILARGIQGLGSLFWFESDDGLAFSRDLATLFRCPWIPRDPNWARIPEYLVFDHVAGGETLYNGIRELLPGEVLTMDLGKAVTTLHGPSLPLTQPLSHIELPDLLQRTASTLQSSTERLWAVGPSDGLGQFLSGGVDSALMAEALTKCAPSHVIPGLTVTCPGYKHDEAAFARSICAHLDLPGAEIPMEPDAFATGWHEAIRAIQSPLTSTNQVSWWILCRSAKAKGWSVVFSGEGADGWIAGGLYDSERADIARLWDRDPKEVASRVIFCRTHSLNDPALIKKILKIHLDISNRRGIWEEIRDRETRASPDEMAVLYHVRTTSNRLLTRADLVAACHGIQLRLPYLEAEWLSLMRALPFHVRNAQGIRKWPLKFLCAKRWGEEFAHRKKIGFPFPLRTWIRDAPNPLLHEWREMLLTEETLSREIYRKDELTREVRLRLEGRIRPADWLLWSLINLELWLREIGW